MWEIGREKQVAGQSHAPGRVMWTKCLPRDTIQPMEYTLRNSNEIICKHRKLPLQVPGKVFGESEQSVQVKVSDVILPLDIELCVDLVEKAAKHAC